MTYRCISVPDYHRIRDHTRCCCCYAPNKEAQIMQNTSTVVQCWKTDTQISSFLAGVWPVSRISGSHWRMLTLAFSIVVYNSLQQKKTSSFRMLFLIFLPSGFPLHKPSLSINRYFILFKILTWKKCQLDETCEIVWKLESVQTRSRLCGELRDWAANDLVVK